MAAITGDGITSGSSEWLIDYTNRRIYKSTGYLPNDRHTANELYSWIMDIFDNSTQMDDTIPMSASTPTEFTLINGWYIPEVSYGYISGGSIKSLGFAAGDGTGGTYTNGIIQVTLSATTAASTDIGKAVVFGSGGTGVLVDYNNTTRIWHVRRTAGATATFAGTSTITSGTAGQGTASGAVSGEDVWANFYTLGSIESDGVVYWYQNGAVVASYPGYSTGHCDQLIQVTNAGTDISTNSTARAIVAFMRNNASSNADLYDHFQVTAPATGGRNPIPLATAPDLNDNGQSNAIGSVTITFGTYARDFNLDGTNENYYCEINGAGLTVATLYKVLKYRTSSANTGNTSTDSSMTTQGRFYTKSNASVPVSNEVKQAPFGTFAGGKFFGAQGVYVTNVSDASNISSLIDTAGTLIPAASTFSVTVSGVASGDRILLARSSSGLPVTTQLTKASSTSTTITVSETLSNATYNDLPSAGGGSVASPATLRLGNAVYTYTGITKASNRFDGVSPDPTSNTATNVWIPLIDTTATGTSVTSLSLKTVSDLTCILRVRQKGILPFEQPTLSITSVGGNTLSAIRTTDSIAV